MADVNINKFRASVVRDGSKPASPGFIVSEGQDPVDPAGTGQNHLPVTIAAAATGLSITESQVLGGAGTTLQYLRGDGSLATFPDLTGYVPYTGANQTVNLNTQQLQAGHTTLTTNGSTETLTINHTSGSGKAINVTKGGNGEGLYVNKTSGSGNAATIVGTLEATTLVKTGGTSSQFLKADGSVDSSTYGTGTVTSVGLSSATSGVTIGSTPVTTSGTITLAIATASGSQNGLLSSTDWTTFNSKQNALTNPVTGTGTTNTLPKFTGASTIGNSNIQDSGTLVTVAVAAAFSSTVSGSYGGTFVIPSESPASGSVALVAKTSNGANDIFRWFDGATTLGVFKNNGNVLIGTTTDNGARLQVSGTATVAQLTSLSASGNAALLLKDSSANNKWEIGHVSNSLYFYNYTTGTNPLVITGSNGTSSFETTSAINAIFNSTNASGGYIGFRRSGTNIGYLGNSAQLGIGVNNALELRADNNLYLTTTSGILSMLSTGNVGIGTTNPLLENGGGQVIYNSTVPRLAFRNSTSGTTALDGTDLALVSSDFFVFNRESGAIIFGTSGLPQMRITSSGNVGIGTTSPAYKLDINETSSPATIGLKSNGTYNSIIRDYITTTDTYLDVITERTDGGGFNFLLLVSSTLNVSGSFRNYYTFAVQGRGTTATATQISNVSAGTASRTAIGVSFPSNGVIRLTLTGGETCQIKVSAIGHNSL